MRGRLHNLVDVRRWRFLPASKRQRNRYRYAGETSRPTLFCLIPLLPGSPTTSVTGIALRLPYSLKSELQQNLTHCNRPCSKATGQSPLIFLGFFRPQGPYIARYLEVHGRVHTHTHTHTHTHLNIYPVLPILNFKSQPVIYFIVQALLPNP